MPTEEQIKELAYTLWEKDGRPEGKDQESYFNAKRILEEREVARKATKLPEPKPAATPVSYKRGFGKK